MKATLASCLVLLGSLLPVSLGTLLASRAAHDSDKQYPVTKVITLLKDMQAQLTKEAEDAFEALQKLYIKNEPEINNVFNVISGSCIVDDEGCVMSASMKTEENYLNHEDCVIELPPAGADVTLEYFQTEPWYDYIEVNGKEYTSQYSTDYSYPSGTDLGTAQGRYCAYMNIGYDFDGECQRTAAGKLEDQKKLTGSIKWKTDYSVLASGFKFCAVNNVDTKDNAIQYYPLMYFVDKQYMEMPTTCHGETIGQPIYFKSVHSCAAACDAEVGKCVGFSFYPDKVLQNNNGPNICFLFSKFDSARYYTGCESEEEKPKSFLQKHNTTAEENPSKIVEAPEFPVCALKLSQFVGTTIKPDPSGKCKGCLKELTTADRCYN